MDARRISVSSGRKELSVSAKILRRISSCGRTSKANGVNQIAVVDIVSEMHYSEFRIIIAITKKNYFILTDR